MTAPRSTGLRVGRTILGLAAGSALLAAFDATGGLAQAGSDTLMLEAWRTLGLAVFAGLFALLAWRPTAFPGVLELAIAHKAALTAFASASPDALGARTVLVADGLLTIALIAAYLLVGGHRGWRRREVVGDRQPPSRAVVGNR
jgi:hypothetical protein